MTSWLKRSGIQKDADDQTGADAPAEDTTPSVKNDKATPVIENERGIPSVNNKSFRSKALPLTFAAVALTLVGLVWIIPGPKPQVVTSKDDPRATKDQRFDENKPSAVLVPNAPPAPPEPPPSVNLTPAQPTPLATPKAPITVIPAPDKNAGPGGQAGAAAVRQRPLTPLELRQQSKTLIVGTAEKGSGAGAPAGPVSLAPNPGMVQTSAPASNFPLGPGGAGGSGTGSPDKLAEALRPTEVKGVAAGRLADRTFMIAQGAMLDCNMDVAVSSAVPGMVKCTLTRNVQGDDGTVTLLERGTELTGQYQGALVQGQNRLFVLWARAKTPHGVIINLASPGTDALGRSGVDGFIDTHFWERFGAALMLSVLDDALAIAVSKAKNNSGGGSGTTVVLPQSTTQAGKNAAALAVENSIRIPPTLNKNQGEHVSVFVARDLDFRSVYAIQPAADLGSQQ